MANLSNEVINEVKEVLEENGYTNVDYFFNNFNFTNPGRKKYCELRYNFNEFCVGTISSTWPTNEVNEYVEELQKINKLAKELNEIIK